MMHGSGAIDAIREFRAEFGCGLMEAKVMWDRHHSLDKMREAMRESGIPELDNVRADRLQRELIELTALREAEAAELIELRMRFSDSVSFELKAHTAETLDAERYRFLRNTAMSMDDAPSVVAGSSGEFDFLEGSDMDGAVDEAIKEWKSK